jgi:hypothetical protein
MSTVMEWALIGLGAVVVGTFLGGMLVLGMVMAHMQLDRENDPYANQRERERRRRADDSVCGVRGPHADPENLYPWD